MSTNDTAGNKSPATTDVQKRAEWEAFEFSVPERGRVRVENHSHEDPSEHTYDVDVEHGSAVACTCPADEYNETCKHRVAVEANAPVLAAAAGVVTDGGMIVADDDGELLDEDSDDERPDDCDCDGILTDLPCWPCYRDADEGGA